MRIGILITIFLFSFLLPVHVQAAVGVSAHNAVLMEQSSGRVLFEKNAHEKRPIASITKIMTAIIAIESGMMDENAVASRRAVYTEGSSIYLEQGEKISIEDLVYGLMLRSGNDAAVAISEHVGGSVEGFAHLMNEKARWIGMTNTNFENPHGLHSDNHYSTAYDMALLMQYAMDNDIFRKISGTSSYLSKNRSYSWMNKNKLLTRYYDSCTGGKTGFTKKAGRTLVTSAKKNGMDLIVVTLNAPDDWRDHISLYEWGFENYNMHTMVEEGTSKYNVEGTKNQSTGYVLRDVVFPLTTNEANSLTRKSFQKEDDTLSSVNGQMVFYLDSKPILEIPIFQNKAVDRNESNLLDDILSIYKQVIGWK